MMAVSLPPFDLWPVAFVGLVPLGVSVCGEGVARHRAIAGGLWFGGLFYGTVLHWVPFTLSGILPFGFVLGCLAIAVLACTCGLQLLAVRELVAGRTVLSLLAFPAVWVTTETLIAHAGTLAMPWTPLGLALAGTPTLAGLAEWGGVRGLSLWIALVNGGLVASMLSPHGRWRWVGAVGVLGLTLGPVVLGVTRDRGLRTTSLPPILLTQIHLTREVLRDPDLRDRRVGETLERVLEPWQAAGGRTDRAPLSLGNDDPVVALLPEAPFRQEWNQALRDRMTTHARDLGIPVLVGAYVKDRPPTDSDRSLNAIMLVEPGGEIRLVHAKLRLVPGVENPGFARGAKPGVLQLSGLSMGFAICFESAFGRDAARARRDGAQVLINPTNDGWFAPYLAGVGSAGHAQHRAHLILRATESRMTAVRSSLGGELLAIGPDGRVKVRSDAGHEGAAVVIPSIGPMTSYVRYGDIGGGSAASLLGVLLILRVVGLRNAKDDPSLPGGPGREDERSTRI